MVVIIFNSAYTDIFFNGHTLLPKRTSGFIFIAVGDQIWLNGDEIWPSGDEIWPSRDEIWLSRDEIRYG
jgi:hypothetical protein